MNIHEAPKSEAERLELLQLIAEQERQIQVGSMVNCPGCRAAVDPRQGYRCYFCGLLFCRRCAGVHFSSKVMGRPSQHEEDKSLGQPGSQGRAGRGAGCRGRTGNAERDTSQGLSSWA